MATIPSGPSPELSTSNPVLDFTVDALRAALSTWASRDDSKPQPHVRRAANDAVSATDALLAHLHQIRTQLLAEIRLSDDAAAARVDALLAGGAR